MGKKIEPAQKISELNLIINKQKVELLRLSEVENLLNTVLDVVAGIHWWKDKDGVYRGCNEEMVAELGLKTKNDIIGKTDYQLPWSEQADALIQNDHEVMRTGQIQKGKEELVKTNEGEIQTFMVAKAPLYDETGQVIGTVGNSINITQQKLLEQELRTAKKEAEKVLYLRAAAGSIAHELRTPLASIKMAAEFIAKFWAILLSSYKLAREKQLEVQEIPNRAMLQLDGRIDSVLQQTRYANAFIDLVLGNLKEEEEINTDNYHACGMVDVVNQCVSRYPFAQGEDALIQWKTDNDFQFNGDEFFMINVLNNLIKNALYFIKDARKGEMIIWLENGDSFNTLYFKDTAKGAPADVVARLFESFYSKRQGGTGLGLAFCKKIMKSFGGDIVATSVEGEYMQFALSFPVQALR